MAGLHDDRDSVLYNGVSNRSRGWKSRKLTDFVEGRMVGLENVKRWDGAARMSYEWNNLRRVSESLRAGPEERRRLGTRIDPARC